MDTLQNNEAVQQLMKLLEENGRQGQAADLSALIWCMDGMSRQYDAVLQELQQVRQQLAQAQESPAKKTIGRMVTALEEKARWVQDVLAGLREKIILCARDAGRNFKEAGVSALDRAVSAINAKNTLEHLREDLSGMLADIKRSIARVEDLGHELRSAGGHLRNAGRTVAGREAWTVDGGQEGRFQSAVLVPLRSAQKLLSGMNNAALAAIGGLEHLEVSAEAAREARVERQAAKKSSIRQVLAEKKAEIAAQPAPSQERKTPEVSL